MKTLICDICNIYHDGYLIIYNIFNIEIRAEYTMMIQSMHHSANDDKH